MSSLCSSLTFIIMAELIFFLLDLVVKLSTCWKVYGMLFYTQTPALFYFQQYFEVMCPLGSSLIYILMTELFFFFWIWQWNWAHIKNFMVCFFYTYIHALFYFTTFWCNELSWFIPHVYHNARTLSFSFGFGSETEHMWQNLW